MQYLEHKVTIGCSTLIVGLALAFGGMNIANAVTPISVTPSTQQGIKQWPALGGKLVLVTGTFQDVLTYKRSMTFYFEAKPGDEWNHVPIDESDVDHSLSWFSISRGEDTLEDAVVTTRGSDIYLIVASRKATSVPATAIWYKFVEIDGNINDGAAYQFVPIGSKSHVKTLSIDDVLKKEGSAKPPAANLKR